MDSIPPPIFVVSGATGASGELVVRTVLAQFRWSVPVEPGQLMAYRRWRQARLGVSGPSLYTDPAAIYEEVEEALHFCQRQGFTVVDVTDKPVESSADEVILAVTSRLKSQPAA